MSDIFDRPALSNLTEFSVTELSGSIKRTVETAFDQVRVRGEISGYRGPHSSGHAYFSLKDDRSRIDAVIWKGSFSKMKFRPEEGMEVIATGKITTFPGSSKYQIVIENLEPAGAGALMALLEERRRKLAAEGLFDQERKRRLPYMPKVIGVVTSPTGAVIRDILHRISDRFPVHVVVWPVKVQGEGSGEEVANAIRGFNALQPGDEIARPDVLIVARGGGSLEDLWSFNDEIVVRAAAESTIPLISAVGHETDWTLIDHAADVRAPTPTGAAEMAVPVRADLEAQLSGMSARLQSSMSRKMDYHSQGLKALVRALPSLDQLLALPRRRFDEASIGLGRGLEFNTLNKRRSFERVSSHLRPDVLTNGLLQQRQRIAERMQRADSVIERRLLQATSRITSSASSLRSIPARLLGQLERQKERVETSMRRADTAIVNRMSHKRSGIASHDRILQSLSYKNVLKRGYAVIRDEHNTPLTRAGNVAAGQMMSIEFADGAVSAVAGEVGEIAASPVPAVPAPAPRKRPAKPEGQGGSNQGSLF